MKYTLLIAGLAALTHAEEIIEQPQQLAQAEVKTQAELDDQNVEE